MGSGWFRLQRMDGEGRSQSRVISGSANSSPMADIADLVALLLRRQANVTDLIDCDDNQSDESDVAMPTQQPSANTTSDAAAAALNASDFRIEQLQHSGHYGPIFHKGQRVSLSRLMQQRESGTLRKRQKFAASDRCAISSCHLPAYVHRNLEFTNKVFCGTYSQDGNAFLSACQDRRIRVFDTRCGQFREIRCIQALDVGWSILDLALSPDGNYVVYSSWSDYLHIANVFGDNKVHQPLPLCPEAAQNFCMFSVVFSQDNKELLGGGNDGCLYVYDRRRNERTLRIDAHEDDVNAVMFADETSHILYSGSDDGLCKIWDRRTLRESNPCPVAVMAGHADGITFIDTKGDSRYFISNSKDQTIKLWDMRVPSPPEVQEAARREVARRDWDYRWQPVPKKVVKSYSIVPGETSLMTYRGHCVLNTLLRARFSPLFNTGQQYIYAGCATGAVIVYDVLTGKIVTKLINHQACVRDVSWHPFENTLVSSSWDCSVTEWTNSSLDEDIDVESKGRSRRCAKQRPRGRITQISRH